jgi:hypothetical protein
MSTDKKYYVQRSIDELPKESGWYIVLEDVFALPDVFHFMVGKGWIAKELHNTDKDFNWLEPVTIEQILSEHPEEVEKYRREGFEAAREENPTEIVRYSHNACLIVHTGGQKTKYPTAQDYIDSLKPTQP